jgi:Rps23 Pro-64 3,4-dihydroxylase Tpa1-like proline 4-hydroxylase
MLDRLDGGELRDRYLDAKPWPHLVVDDVVAPELAVEIAAEVHGLPNDTLVTRRSRRQVKLTSAGTDELGARTRSMLNLLSSPAITALAETVTGITGLESDPEFCRAGVFVTPPGGWQRVHEDFPVHPVTGLWNRVVVLLYCSDWDPAWGGALELWPPDMASVGERVEPLPGRLVMFEPTSSHRHGIQPVSVNAGARVVLASRFYAATAPVDPPSPPLRRWIHRPGEHRRDIWPTPSEAARELRARLRRSLRSAPVRHGPHDASY